MQQSPQAPSSASPLPSSSASVSSTTRTFNALSGLLLLGITALEASRILPGKPWEGPLKIIHLVAIVVAPLWLISAAMLFFHRRANEHSIFLWGTALITVAHGMFLILAGNTAGFAFVGAILLLGLFQGLRAHLSGTSPIEKVYPGESLAHH